MAVSQKDFIKWLADKCQSAICQNTTSCIDCEYYIKNNKFHKQCNTLNQIEKVELAKDKFEQELLKERGEKNE